MAFRSVLHRFETGAAVPAALVLLATAAPAAAQGQRTSSMTVGATVVRTCTVEQVRPSLPETPSPAAPGQTPMPTPGPTYRLRCGQQVVNYPVQPGTAVPTAKAPAAVAGSPHGRGLVIQF